MRHHPAEPFGIVYDTPMPSEHARWKDLFQVEYCISRPPLGGLMDPCIQKYLTITSIIRTGRDRGAQIVVVYCTMVAKIFDPLYYSAPNECGYPDDVVVDADGDYCCEAATFQQLLLSSEAKAVTPAYFGTWSLEV
jgi:hypothetical protein